MQVSGSGQWSYDPKSSSNYSETLNHFNTWLWCLWNEFHLLFWAPNILTFWNLLSTFANQVNDSMTHVAAAHMWDGPFHIFPHIFCLLAASASQASHGTALRDLHSFLTQPTVQTTFLCLLITLTMWQHILITLLCAPALSTNLSCV